MTTKAHRQSKRALYRIEGETVTIPEIAQRTRHATKRHVEAAEAISRRVGSNHMGTAPRLGTAAEDAEGGDAVNILAIDPGTDESGFVHLVAGKIVAKGMASNHEMKTIIRDSTADVLAIEMIASYGMAVGKEVFATCVWIGRFIECWPFPGDVKLVFRQDVKMHLCKSPRAKDGNIRQALIDLLGEQGTKKNPGPTYGVSKHMWPALAVAVTFAAGASRS